MLGAARTEEESAILLFALHTGARAGEQIAVEWGDLDWTNHLVVLRRSSTRGEVGPTKSGRERRVALTGTLEKALKQIRHLRGAARVLQPGRLAAPARAVARTDLGRVPARWAAKGAVARPPALVRVSARVCRRSAAPGAGVARALDDHHDDALRAPGPRGWGGADSRAGVARRGNSVATEGRLIGFSVENQQLR